jgi:anti-anti-sigma factor
LENALSDVIDEGTSRIILDFMRVTYLSSAGIGVIISMRSEMAERFMNQPYEIIILNPIESVRDVFDLLQMGETCPIAENDTEAVKRLLALQPEDSGENQASPE